MNKRNGLIYVITNNINGKQYIGQTISTLNERWAGHKCDSNRKETAMALALKKYGFDNFSIESIEENIPYEELDNKEIDYIKEYNTICPNGYNISHGGQSFKTEEEIEYMRQRVLGENNPMYGMCGELNPFYGKEHSDEYKRKSSIRTKEWYDNLEQSKKEEISDRLMKFRIEMTNTIGSGMKGKNHSEKTKLKIKNAMTGRIITDEHRKNLSKGSTNKKSIIMIDLKTEEEIMCFESIRDANKWLIESNIMNNITSGEISNVCNGKKKTAYGYKWKYK